MPETTAGDCAAIAARASLWAACAAARGAEVKYCKMGRNKSIGHDTQAVAALQAAIKCAIKSMNCYKNLNNNLDLSSSCISDR